MTFFNCKRSLWLLGLMLALFSGGCQREQAAVTTPAATPAPTLAVAATEQPVSAEAEALGEPGPTAPLNLLIANAYRAAGMQSRELEIQEVDFRKRPVNGALVTLIPLGVNLPITTTRILSAARTPDPCSDSLPPWWSYKLAPLTQPEFVKIEAPTSTSESDVNYPFKIGVLYPAVENVQALNRGLLDAATLPKGVRPDQVLLALDLDGDQLPDLLQAEYCCDKPQLALKDCDLTCRKTWQRTAGQWKVIDAGTPC